MDTNKAEVVGSRFQTPDSRLLHFRSWLLVFYGGMQGSGPCTVSFPGLYPRIELCILSHSDYF